MSDSHEPRFLTRIIAWSALIGAACVFGSWIAQNYLQSAAEADAQRLERIFTSVFSEEQNLTQWLIEYNRAVSEDPQNSERVEIAAASLSKSVLRLLDRASMPSSLSIYAVTIGDKHDQSMEVDRLLQAKDYEKLVANLNDLMARYESEIPFDEHALALFDAFRRSNQWNDLFLKLFILGSALLGLAYLLRNWTILFGTLRNARPRLPNARATDLEGGGTQGQSSEST